ncbi:hypothetical protein [Mycobacterium sp.]|uniref:hypothetical protein n=1 Tax=Mycobacterium sp. TaxID=1785 RepID=UPI003F99F57F
MRVVLSHFMSLDGVVQAPGGHEEDSDGGFAHGGWSIPFFEPDAMGPAVADVMALTEALLFGRRTGRRSDERDTEVRGLAHAQPRRSHLAGFDAVTGRRRDRRDPRAARPGGLGEASALELVSTAATATGVLICTYRPR